MNRSHVLAAWVAARDRDRAIHGDGPPEVAEPQFGPGCGRREFGDFAVLG